MDFTAITNAALVLIAAVITTVIVPFIKSKTTAEQQQQLADLASIAAKAAEQALGSKKGQEKKEYALNFLSERGINADEAAVLIEAAVHNLKQ